MKMLCIFLCAYMLWVPAFAKDEARKLDAIASVEQAVAHLTNAMVEANAKVLKALSSPKLSYGHSSGRVENQTQFLESIASGASDFVNIELTKQTIEVSGDIAIVRHNLKAKTYDHGKPGEVFLGVMLVWQKHNERWQLVARQAFRYPS